ncbi:hypothetical protein LVO79_01005 [Roseivivax marinus]|uniref:hypothetical protein n=1 Tax=Roseivivax marinus TaxID=1379903 RepID=UPI001F04EB2B|nr:hypothetical protein [Roseivivax marinus]UMA65087.1 hypothetical protein LVO79_01005 [Roseivivax marinus]
MRPARRDATDTGGARARAYRDAVARRRAFRLPGYVTLAEAGFDGEWVSPIQMTSGALDGPMLMTKDWLDAPSAARHRDRLATRGYLPEIPFNRVLDAALDLLGLDRAAIYVAPVFCLLRRRCARTRCPPPTPAPRSRPSPATRSWAVARSPPATTPRLRHFDVPHVATIHPSRRGLDYAARARLIADALEAA